MWKSKGKEYPQAPGPNFGTGYLVMTYDRMISVRVMEQYPHLRLKCFQGREEFYLHVDLNSLTVWVEEKM